MPRPRAHLDLEALADAFAADGLHGVSANALAAALGVAKPTLYAHGVSKESLFLRAVEAEVERVIDVLHAGERASVGRSARERATTTAHALLDHAADRPHGARLLARTAHHANSGVAAQVNAALRRIPERIAAGLRRDLAADGLDPEPALFLARGLHGAVQALGERRPGERRPARWRLAASAAALVPSPPAPTPEAWPTA